VPAGGSADYPITYHPVTMASPSNPHEGSAFFPLPDGSGLLYRLSGQVGRLGGQACRS
jgi:hydrocephalus-inducing protein